MSMPEFVIQMGVIRAWDMIKQDYNYILGQWLKQFKLEKQEEYRNWIRGEDVFIHLGFPTSGMRTPSFSIVPQGESESPEGQYIGHTGPTNRALPFPPVGEDDYPKQQKFFGATYPSEFKSQEPELMGFDGPRVGLETGFIPSTNQNDPNWEQEDLMGEEQKLYGEDDVHLETEITGDDISLGITITTGNSEKTMVYYRLLKMVMRKWSHWFHKNGVQRPVYSGGPLRPNNSIVPGQSVAVFERTLNMTFLFHEVDFRVSRVVNDFILTYELATRNGDGTLDTSILTELRAEEED